MRRYAQYTAGSALTTAGTVSALHALLTTIVAAVRAQRHVPPARARQPFVIRRAPACGRRDECAHARRGRAPAAAAAAAASIQRRVERCEVGCETVRDRVSECVQTEPRLHATADRDRPTDGTSHKVAGVTPPASPCGGGSPASIALGTRAPICWMSSSLPRSAICHVARHVGRWV